MSSCAGKIQINQEFKDSGKGLFIVLSHIKKDKKDEDKEMTLYGSKNTAMVHFYEKCPNGKRVTSNNRKQYTQCEWCESPRNASYDQYAEKVMSAQV